MVTLFVKDFVFGWISCGFVDAGIMYARQETGTVVLSMTAPLLIFRHNLLIVIVIINILGGGEGVPPLDVALSFHSIFVFFGVVRNAEEIFLWIFYCKIVAVENIRPLHPPRPFSPLFGETNQYSNAISQSNAILIP